MSNLPPHMNTATNIDAELERATTTSLHHCDTCGHLHVLLRDEEGIGYADFIVSIERLEEMLSAARAIKDHFDAMDPTRRILS